MPKRPSYKEAIKLKCINCIYDSSLRESPLTQVRKCIDDTCALYHVRPLPRKRK